tara:strand:+ start:2573 stop:2794 length:222 start_codon:yes stop_codon:yes gene_type:complete
MKITIKFNTDNEAFEGSSEFEKINIEEVQNVIDQAKRSVTRLIESNWDYSKVIRDTNGNMVGYLKIESKKLEV